MLYIQTTGTIAYVLIHTATFTFHMSCSLMVDAFCNDIQTIFNRMDSIVADNSQGSYTQLKTEFGIIIRFHGKIIAWDEFRSICQILFWKRFFLNFFRTKMLKFGSEAGFDHVILPVSGIHCSCCGNRNIYISCWNGNNTILPLFFFIDFIKEIVSFPAANGSLWHIFQLWIYSSHWMLCAFNWPYWPAIAILPKK